MSLLHTFRRTPLEAIPMLMALSFLIAAFNLCLFIRRAQPSPSRSEWSLVWSNGVACPVAIARDVNGRLEKLPVDYSRFKP